MISLLLTWSSLFHCSNIGAPDFRKAMESMDTLGFIRGKLSFVRFDTVVKLVVKAIRSTTLTRTVRSIMIMTLTKTSMYTTTYFK